MTNPTPTRVLLQTKPEIEAWLQEYGIKKYTILDDLRVDVHEGVNIKKPLDFFPVNFNHIEGAFECKKIGLKSLEGAPRVVESDADFSYNELTTLQGSPELVQSCFKVHKNQLTSLAHGPQEIWGPYFADTNPIKTLLDFTVFKTHASNLENDGDEFMPYAIYLPNAPDLIREVFTFDAEKVVENTYGLSYSDIAKIKDWQDAYKERQLLDKNLDTQAETSNTLGSETDKQLKI